MLMDYIIRRAIRLPPGWTWPDDEDPVLRLDYTCRNFEVIAVRRRDRLYSAHAIGRHELFPATGHRSRGPAFVKRLARAKFRRLAMKVLDGVQRWANDLRQFECQNEKL